MTYVMPGIVKLASATLVETMHTCLVEPPVAKSWACLGSEEYIGSTFKPRTSRRIMAQAFSISRTDVQNTRIFPLRLLATNCLTNITAAES